MNLRRFPVTLEPAGVTVWAEEGDTVLDVARRAGVMIPAPCGGRGVCGKCAIKVTAGAGSPPDSEELVGLKLAPKGVRLACRMRVTGPISIKPVVAARTISVLGESIDDEPLVAGVDIGTTSVSAVVIGALSGRQLGRSTAPNRQAVWGADVLARVAAAESGQGVELQAAVTESVLEALCAACGSACSCLGNVVRVVVAGNSVMTSAVLGDSLAGFAAHPFAAERMELSSLPDGWQGEREIVQDMETLVLPPIASFVGSDTTAALLAAGLVDSRETCILVDMGTNAEVAVTARGGLLVTSAAAGPALEGMGIRCGGPYGDGAIVGVHAQGPELSLDVIGGVEPAWLAGSGLISAIATLRSLGHLDATGAMRSEGPLSESFVMLEDILAVTIYESDDAAIVLTQLDVRSFQQAKAGVAAAIYLAVKAERLKPRKIARLVVTGALGAAAGTANLIDLGVLPSDLSDIVESVDAAALTGAGMIATDPDLLDTVQPFTQAARHLDLAAGDAFAETFMAALALEPYTLKRGF